MKESSKEKKEQKQQEERNDQELAYNSSEQTTEGREVHQPAAIEIDKTTVEPPTMSEAVALDDKMHKENINTDPVTKAGVQTPDKSSTSDDAVQYASNAENKKFRGFFRKATRIIERTTSISAADDDKVLIGGMAINLK